MNRFSFFTLSVLFLLMIGRGGVSATPEVIIESYEEAGSLNNYSKPRIRITNRSSTESISNFSLCYYFTAENGKIPLIADYYTPRSIATLEATGDGNYLVRYTFTGVTLYPGQTLPDNGGSVIGLHYTDDSNFDKSDDHSNNQAASYTLNGNITIFLGDGTQIYGNTPAISNPTDPPQPPGFSADIGSFTVYSKDYTKISDNVVISGSVGSAQYTEIGCKDTINNDVITGGTVSLRENAYVAGDVIYGQNIIKQNSITINGTEQKSRQITLPILSIPDVNYETTAAPIEVQGAYTLSPGSYSTFTAHSGAMITVQPGMYTFQEFNLDVNVTFMPDMQSDGEITLHIQNNCRIGNTCTIGSTSGTAAVTQFTFLSAQTTMLYIGTDVQMHGIVHAPDAEIHVNPRTILHGMLYGRKIFIEPDVSICGAPTLAGLTHSEGAMAPPFSPVVFNYVAVVPDATSTITVTPQARDGSTTTVNGNDPSYPVELSSGAETDIVMILTHPEACGTTKYSLKVTRLTDNVIYVNPNATGVEDGRTFETGFHDLQHALDIATEQGIEIRVAEGEYIPTTRTNPTDPRSATFTIQGGIELTGISIDPETGEERENASVIFSGDVLGNDSALTEWPADETEQTCIEDNLYRAITITGDCRISNITVTHCNAHGENENATAGGILIESGTAHLDYVSVIDNSSDMGGAVRVTRNGAIDTLKNCLFQNNTTRSGTTGGLIYESSTPLVIDASVFDGNSADGTSDDFGGSALYFSEGSMYLLNCVFSENRSESDYGAVFNDGGELYVDFCTFAFNASQGAKSISNKGDATSKVTNSILWNKEEEDEVNGTGFDITWSCMTNATSGWANMDEDPLFRDENKPAGDDGAWGSYDDGLQLTVSSPCLNQAWFYSPIDVDILTTERSLETVNDRGAYEYTAYADKEQEYWGIKYGNGQFIYNDSVYIYKPFANEWRRILAAKSTKARYVRALVPKSKYTKHKDEIIAYVYPTINGNVLSDVARLEVTLVREGTIEEDNAFLPDNYIYFSDRPFVFINDKNYVNSYAGSPYNEAYFLYAEDDATFGYRCVIPSSQF